ncbi:hypothetical protein SKAU_G00035920 [Synaphobranchus kaupii]|uniref:Prolactin n=1 Tax=Synaphobranchus kaupii TaxID=118154 RepID=A0A9Q1JH30_SYNKA|nr:hypothetical protein SKAU_G00035920 [Synaphobranchus kaupii]
MSRDMTQASVLFLVLLSQDLLVGIRSVPVCAHGHAGCPPVSLAELFDRVIQHSARMHGISSDLHSEFREELTGVILKILLAWRDPLSQFQRNVAHHEDSKAQEMSDMAHKLRSGVEKVAEKMQLLGMFSNSLSGPSLAGDPHPPSSSGETGPMSDYELLHCFRRDSDKVQSFLRILKCRIFPEHEC